LPTFIQYKGSKDKIYLENNGMWIFDVTSQWVYINSVGSVISKELVFEKLNFLNKIKFDVGNYNLNMIQLEMENKRKEITNDVRDFFDKFSNMDAHVFSDLRQSVQESQVNFIGHMEHLKENVSKYFNEGPPEKDKNLIRRDFEEDTYRKRNAVKMMKMPRQEMEKMDMATGGFYSLQYDKMRNINKFKKELANIQQ